MKWLRDNETQPLKEAKRNQELVVPTNSSDSSSDLDDTKSLEASMPSWLRDSHAKLEQTKEKNEQNRRRDVLNQQRTRLKRLRDEELKVGRPIKRARFMVTRLQPSLNFRMRMLNAYRTNIKRSQRKKKIISCLNIWVITKRILRPFIRITQFHESSMRCLGFPPRNLPDSEMNGTNSRKRKWIYRPGKYANWVCLFTLRFSTAVGHIHNSPNLLMK